MSTENLKRLEENTVNNKSSLSLIEVFLIIMKRKKTIILMTLSAMVISIIFYFFIFDLIYFSSATIKSSGTSSNLLGSLGGISDFGVIDDFGLTGGKSTKELAAYEEIITSRRCLEALILKYNLMERDKYEFLEDAVKDFRENRLTLKQEKISGVLYIGVYDKDRYLAKEMVEFLLSELDKINIEMNVLQAKNNREFLEKRYLLTKQNLTNAEDSMKAFQRIYGIAPDLQIKASAQSMFTLEGELKSEEVKLEVLKKILNSGEPEVKTQEAKVNSLRNKISEINSSTDLNQFLRLGNSPQIAMSFLRLQRDVEIQGKILAFLLPLYEQARIEENRLTPTVLVLDKPFVSERKSKPKRLTMTVFWTFFTFGFSCMLVVIFDKLRNFRESIVSAK